MIPVNIALVFLALFALRKYLPQIKGIGSTALFLSSELIIKGLIFAVVYGALLYTLHELLPDFWSRWWNNHFWWSNIFIVLGCIIMLFKKWLPGVVLIGLGLLFFSFDQFKPIPNQVITLSSDEWSSPIQIYMGEYVNFSHPGLDTLIIKYSDGMECYGINSQNRIIRILDGTTITPGTFPPGNVWFKSLPGQTGKLTIVR